MPEMVRVRTEELLGILRANRDAHREIFNKAQVKYRERVIAELDQRLKDAREGRQIDMIIHLPVPEDHTSDYDAEIRMLEMSTTKEIKIRRHEFDNYVMDNWSWSRSFAANSISYTQQ